MNPSLMPTQIQFSYQYSLLLHVTKWKLYICMSVTTKFFPNSFSKEKSFSGPPPQHCFDSKIVPEDLLAKFVDVRTKLQSLICERRWCKLVLQTVIPHNLCCSQERLPGPTMSLCVLISFYSSPSLHSTPLHSVKKCFFVTRKFSASLIDHYPCCTTPLSFWFLIFSIISFIFLFLSTFFFLPFSFHFPSF